MIVLLLWQHRHWITLTNSFFSDSNDALIAIPVVTFMVVAACVYYCFKRIWLCLTCQTCCGGGGGANVTVVQQSQTAAAPPAQPIIITQTFPVPMSSSQMPAGDDGRYARDMSCATAPPPYNV